MAYHYEIFMKNSFVRVQARRFSGKASLLSRHSWLSGSRHLLNSDVCGIRQMSFLSMGKQTPLNRSSSLFSLFIFFFLTAAKVYQYRRCEAPPFSSDSVRRIQVCTQYIYFFFISQSTGWDKLPCNMPFREMNATFRN